MEDFVKKLDFDSDTFEVMKKDMNFVLQRLLDNMVEKKAREGSMTVKIDIEMISEYIPNYNPEVEGETRECLKPQFEHKVTSQVKISDEKKGNMNSEMELVMDEETGLYIMRPVADTTQKSIFDADYRCVNDPSEDDTMEVPDAIEESDIPALPFNGEPEEYAYDEPEE